MGLHDKLFKQVVREFVLEFLQLFYPDVRAYLDDDSLIFLDKEFFPEVGKGRRGEADVVVRANWRGQDTFFIINIEGQGRDHIKDFQERFFLYCIYLYLKYRVPIYPIVVFYDEYPAAAQPHTYQVGFPDLAVFEFHYRVIQLNKLAWRDFAGQPNPVANALVARMKMKPEERPLAKLATLQTLTGLTLTPEQVHLLSSFIDTYLDLDEVGEAVFQAALAEMEPAKQEEVMELTTSWMRKGIQIGEAQGIQIGEAQGIQIGEVQGQQKMILRLLQHRLGNVTTSQQTQIARLTPAQLEDLSVALLDFRESQDLAKWLGQVGGN